MEIERKFLVKEIPGFVGIRPSRYERYYLKRESGIEERIQEIDGRYEYELKKEVSSLERTREKKIIDKVEFEKLKNQASDAIIRDGYSLSQNVSIKIYHGRFEGLQRVEVEFTSKEEAEKYMPEAWMGEEITNLPLGRDSKLLDLSDAEFKSLLGK